MAEPANLEKRTLRPARTNTPVTEAILQATIDTRTRDILHLLAAGLTTSEITERLGYSERQGRRVVQQAIVDTGSRTAAQAVHKATIAGILSEYRSSGD